MFLFPKSKELQNFLLFATLRQTESSNASSQTEEVDVPKIYRLRKFVEGLEDPSFHCVWVMPGNAGLATSTKIVACLAI